MNTQRLIVEVRERHPQIYAGLSTDEKQKLVEMVSNGEPTPKTIDRAYRQLKTKRQEELNEYFRDYENPECDGYELQKRSHDLAISAKEWGEYHNRQQAKAAGAF